MQVFLFAPNFPPAGHPLKGGIEKAVDGLAAGLAELDVEVTVLCEADRESWGVTEGDYQIQAVARDQLVRSFVTETTWTRLVRERMRNGVCVLNGMMNPRVYLLSRLLRRRDVPYVLAPHDPYHPAIFDKRSLMKNCYWHLAESRVLEDAKAVQVLDRRHREYLTDLGFDVPTLVTPNALPRTAIPERQSLDWEIGDPIRVLFLGRIDAHNKGLDLLIDAAAGLDHHVDVTIQGPDWGDRTRLEQRIRARSLSESVRVRPPDYSVSSMEIVEKCDVFCLPSRFEGFGLSALEAMATGRVLMVSSIAGIAPHVARADCGIIVESDVSSIRKGFSRLLARRSEWAEMGRRGRRYVNENLNWRSIAESALETYREIVDSVPAAPVPA